MAERTNRKDKDTDTSSRTAGRHAPCKTQTTATHALGAAAFLLSFIGGVQGEHGRQLPKLGMILAGAGMVGAMAPSVHGEAAVSSSTPAPPLVSPLKPSPWDSLTRRSLADNGCRKNLKLSGDKEWCYELLPGECNEYYFVATNGQLKVLHPL